MSKTDLRVVKTLRQIDQALLENLRQRPFPKITVDQLCQSALINRSTFYKYYQDKFDLMDRYLGRVMEEFRGQMDVAFVTASPQRVYDQIYQRNFQQALEFLLRNRETYMLLWNTPLERPVFIEMVEIIHNNIMERLAAERGEMAGEYRRYADLYARLFASDMMTLVRWWFEDPERLSVQEVCTLMARNMRDGMFKTFRAGQSGTPQP